MKGLKIWATLFALSMIISGLAIMSVGVNPGDDTIDDSGPGDEPKGCQRVVMIEEFTNWGCGPCVPRNTVLRTIVEDYGYDQIAPLFPHTPGPGGGDPIQVHNVNENAARMNYYAFGTIPRSMIDGSQALQTNDEGTLRAKFDERLAVPSPIEITSTGNIDDVARTGHIDCQIKAVDAIADTDLQICFALWEHNFTRGLPGSNGETVFCWPLWNLVGDPDTTNDHATAIWPAGASVDDILSFTRDFTFEEECLPDELGMTIWVQKDAEILNVENVFQAHVQDFGNVPPDVTLQLPDPIAPDQIKTGTNVPIQWNATDDLDDDATLDIDIDYSPDGGTTWFPLYSSPGNTPPYIWDTTAHPDGPNYVLRVTATDSEGLPNSAQSVQPFSIDNTIDDEWFFQVQASGLNMDLDMKPVELTPNSVQTIDFTAALDYQVGAWETTNTFTGATINGAWTFNVYGYSSMAAGVTPPTMSANLYAKVYASSGPLLATTALDDEDIVDFFQTQNLFTWTETLSGAIPNGDSLIVEIWVDVASVTAGPGTNLYNYVGVTQAGGPHDAYFYDCNAMSPAGPDMSTGPPDNEIYEFTDTQYVNVSTSDDTRAISVDPGSFDEIFTWCDMDIVEDQVWLTQIDLTFEGQAGAATDFQIWAYNQATTLWEQIGTAESVGANTDISFTRTITSDCQNYALNGIVTWGCYQTDNSDPIRVDYLEAFITYVVPYPFFVMEFDYGDSQSSVLPSVGGGPSPQPYDIDLTGVGSGDWTFVAFPIDISGDVVTIFDDSTLGDDATTWDYILWYDNFDHEWKSYSIYRPPATNDVGPVDNTNGFWIHITNNSGDQQLTTGLNGLYPGTVNINLYAGWNLVGYPSATSRAGDLTLPAEANLVSVYDLAEPYRIRDELKSTVTFTEGNAYWVRVTANCVWQVNP